MRNFAGGVEAAEAMAEAKKCLTRYSDVLKWHSLWCNVYSFMGLIPTRTTYAQHYLEYENV